MVHGRALILLLMASTAGACKSKDTPRSLDTDVTSAIGRIERRLATPLPVAIPNDDPRLRRELMIQTRRSTFEDCMYLAHLDGTTTVVRDAALLATYTRLCNHDIQIWMLQRLAETAEAARKAKPDAETLPDCDLTDLLIATDELKKNKTADAESAALEARFTAACAPAPGSAGTGSATAGSAAAASAAAGSAAGSAAR